MLHELRRNKCKVVLLPNTKVTALEGKGVWVVESRNPVWYSAILHMFPRVREKGRNRKQNRSFGFDSRLQRKEALRIIQLLMNTGSASVFAQAFLDEARRRRDSEKHETNIEYFFARYHRIVLTNRERHALERLDDRHWEELAEYRKEQGGFPSWLFIETVPF